MGQWRGQAVGGTMCTGGLVLCVGGIMCTGGLVLCTMCTGG